ncbi:MAG: trigger factor [bacterium]|nr:trigger factor [bacterium]MDD5757441.1 trigger factor [bacterium]
MNELGLKATVTRPEPCKVCLEIAIPKEKIEERSNAAFSQIQKVAVLPGFRQGKVPADMVRKSFAKVARDEMLQKLVPEAIEHVAQENNFVPVGETDVEALEFDFDKDLTFKATFEVKPEVKLQDYKGIKVEKEKLEVTDEKLNEALENLRQRAAKLELAGHEEVKKGDFVALDYEMFHEGKPVSETKVQNQIAQVEDDQLLPKFAEQMVGMKKGEQKEIKLTMPADFKRKELAGKEVTVKIAIKEIKEKKLPELNNEFVKELGENITLAELKERIRKNITAQEEARIKENVKEQIVNSLLAAHEFSLPNVLVEKQVDYLVERTKQYITQQGGTTEALGLTEEIMRAKVKHDAERQVKSLLLLEAIGHAEKMEITEEELRQEMGKTKEIYKKTDEEVAEFFEKYHSQIISQMIEDKVFKFLTDNAQITEVAPKKKEK